METRLNVVKIAPADSYKGLLATQHYVDTCGLERSLLDIVLVRVSQINGCAYCIDLHTKEARAHGEKEARLYELDAWRESPWTTAGC